MSGFRDRPEILAGVADHITCYMKEYEDWFTLDAPKLKEITGHFVKELEKGLTVEGGNLVSQVLEEIQEDVSNTNLHSR
jgi:hexokinase